MCCKSSTVDCASPPPAPPWPAPWWRGSCGPSPPQGCMSCAAKGSETVPKGDPRNSNASGSVCAAASWTEEAAKGLAAAPLLRVVGPAQTQAGGVMCGWNHCNDRLDDPGERQAVATPPHQGNASASCWTTPLRHASVLLQPLRMGGGDSLTTGARSAPGRWPPQPWKCSWERAGRGTASSGRRRSPGGAPGGKAGRRAEWLVVSSKASAGSGAAASGCLPPWSCKGGDAGMSDVSSGERACRVAASLGRRAAVGRCGRDPMGRAVMSTAGQRVTHAGQIVLSALSPSGTPVSACQRAAHVCSSVDPQAAGS